ncbi:AAA family ATPase [Sorangium sp. So ce1153]|uniref:AAA family ATPase n=1 Tax=Sorangium sp. So ce1153 TaxID=3133333 RepID=UPI003F5E6403
MLERLELHDTGPAPSMVFELAPRLNLFAGDNGLGKTFVLDVGWFALTGTWPGYPAAPRRGPAVKPQIIRQTRDGEAVHRLSSSFDFEEQQWRTVVPRGASRRSSGLVFYARVDGSFSVWDPLRPAGYQKLPPTTRPSGSGPGFHFTPSEIWNGLLVDYQDGSAVCNGLIRDWATWQLQRGNTFELLTRVLEVLSPNPGETLRPGATTTRVSLHDVRDIPTLDMPYGNVPVVLVSAGMKRILSFAYLLVWTWREHVEAAKLRNIAPERSLVVLVDEVEAHLHPQWQRVILPALLRVSRELEASIETQLLITTHAPLVLASAEPHFDEARDALFLFDLYGTEVTVSKPAWKPRGDASAWLTSDVFDLAQARSVEAEKAILDAMAAMRQPDLPIEDAKRIHEELHDVLKDTDPFWVRWLVRARQAGLTP